MLSYYEALYVSPHRINSGLSDNGCSSVTFASALPPLIFSPTKQPYLKVGNSRMYPYGNAVFLQTSIEIKKIRSGVINFASQRNFKQIFAKNFLLENRMPVFLRRFEYRMEIFQSLVLKKIFQNLCVRLKFNIR